VKCAEIGKGVTKIRK